MPEFCLGFDVGYSQRRRSTGLCLITVDQASFTWVCCNTGTDNDARRNALRELVPCGTNLSGVGIDGPLVQGLGEVNCYRPAEALLNRGRFQGRCNPASSYSRNGPRSLHNHANELANLVLGLKEEGHLRLDEAIHPHRIHQYRIVEAFPTAFLAFLLPENEIPRKIPRAKKSDRYWEIAVERQYLHCLIERLAPGRRLDGDLGQISDHDHRAAFVCALTAMCVERNQYVSVGNPEYGDIVLPPREVWQAQAHGQDSWAKTALRDNVNSVRGDNGQANLCPNFNQARVIRNGHQWMPEPAQ